MIKLSPHDIRDYYKTRLPKLPQRDHEWRGPCPIHGGKRDSLAVQAGTGWAYCHSTCSRGWDIPGFEQALFSCDFPTAVKHISQIVGRDLSNNGTQPERRIVCEYDYCDAEGKLLFQVVRFDPKDFRQRRPDSQGDWIWNVRGLRVVPYRLPAVLKSKIVFIVEGEKDCHSLEKLGLVATCNPGGAGKWRHEYREHFQGKTVYVIPDADGPGRKHAESVAQSLQDVAASVRIVSLPTGKDVSDWIGAGGTAEQLRELAAAASDYIPPKTETGVRKLAEDIAQRYETDGAIEPEKPRPEIKTNNRQLRDVGGEASRALVSGNRPPSVFVRGGRLVRVRLDENKQPIIDNLGEAEVRVLLAQRANFVRVGKDKEAKGFRLSSVSPPTDVTRYVAALGEWELPPLEAVTESPVLRANGSILSRVGYDVATKLFYHRGPELSAPDIPDSPGRRDAQAALTQALEPITEFPFADGASKANAMAAMLTPVVRMAVKGNVPIALSDAPQMGSGKSLLAAVVSIVATGRDEMMPAPSKEEEWQKVMTSCLLRGTTVNVIDNIEQPLQSAALAAMVTSDRWTDRILGKSEMVTLRNHTMWLVTGNNIRLRGDLPRRCYWIRLDAKMPRPYERADFRHDDLHSWVREHRGKILAAMLTMARAWFVAGCPPPQKIPAPMGSFEQWTRTVSGILEYAGVEGFLGNQQTLYDLADEETPQWETFLRTWHEKYGLDPMSTNQIIGQINLESSVLREVLPDTLADALESKNGSFRIKLGKTLGKHVGVRYGDENYRLVQEQDTHANVKLWLVRKD